MKLIRYTVGKTEYRGVTDGEKIKRINGTIFHDYSISNDIAMIDDVKILPPVIPSKIVCIKHNEGKKPSIYFKPPSSIVATNEDIVKPTDVEKLYATLELAIVVGKKCRNVSEKSATNFVLGYTSAINVMGDINEDMTALAHDTFTPLGPIINERLENTEKKPILTINGSPVDITNENYAPTVSYIVSYVSSIMTLLPGDVILAGALNQPVEIHANDVLCSEIGGIGTLTNKVSEQSK